MKYLIMTTMILTAAGEATAAKAATCADAGIPGLYIQAATTGREAARNNLGAAMFNVIRCLSSGGITLPKSQLRGPYSIAIEYLAFTRQVSIKLVSDEEIDALARQLPKSKDKNKKEDCSGGCHD